MVGVYDLHGSFSSVPGEFLGTVAITGPASGMLVAGTATSTGPYPRAAGVSGPVSVLVQS